MPASLPPTLPILKQLATTSLPKRKQVLPGLYAVPKRRLGQLAKRQGAGQLVPWALTKSARSCIGPIVQARLLQSNRDRTYMALNLPTEMACPG